MSLLFQENPRKKSTFRYYMVGMFWKQLPDSYTDSIESYKKKASDLSWVLKSNFRKPNHDIELRCFKVVGVDELKARQTRITRNMKRAKLPFIASVEATRGEDKLPNDTVHYHFLIQSDLNRDELKETMKAVCLNSHIGIYGDDFDVIYPNRGIKTLDRKIDYFCKCGPRHKVHLFKTGLRIQKFFYSRDWFIDENGNKTSKDAILKRLRKEYKENKQREQKMEFGCPVNASHFNPIPFPQSNLTKWR